MDAKLRWNGGLQFVARAGDSPAVVLDNPEGGGGPTPMQMVLMGVAGCTAMDVASIMEKKRAGLTDFTVNVTGAQADDHPRRYTDINIEFVLKGENVTPQAVERSIELSINKYCSAVASLNANLTHTYRIIE
ncbi:MAG: OsmC family protein [Desulfobacterales bacterium]|nr:OsmC family protein [Desulfobacterales bacterium]